MVLEPNATAYRHSAALTPSADTYLVGYGARLYTTSTTGCWYDMNNRTGLLGVIMDGVDGIFSEWVERQEDSPSGEAGKGGYSGFSNCRIGGKAGETNLIVADVQMRGSPTAALWFENVEQANIYGCSVFRSHSDGLHLTKNSGYITVEKCFGSDVGDDFVSCIQYSDATGTPGCPHNIWVKNNTLHGDRARGYTTVGGDKILFEDNYAEGVTGAPFLVAATTAHSLRDTTGIIVRRNVAWRSPSRAAATNQDASLILCRSTSSHGVNGCVFEDNVAKVRATDTLSRSGAVREVNAGQPIRYSQSGNRVVNVTG